jgi:hypothetical protein
MSANHGKIIITYVWQTKEAGTVALAASLLASQFLHV